VVNGTVEISPFNSALKKIKFNNKKTKKTYSNQFTFLKKVYKYIDLELVIHLKD